MRKIIFTIVCAVLVVLMLMNTSTVVAVENDVPLPTPTPMSYTLPYPGILPDHPLYFFKQIRDAVLELLVTDPIRKVQLFILQADKRLVMGQTLLDEGKESVSVEALSSAFLYEQKALAVLVSEKSQGSVIAPYVIEKIESSLRKHIEEMGAMEGKVGESQKERVTQLIAKDNELLSKVGELK